MKKLSNTSYKIIYIFLLYSCAFAQEPFLEIRPYIAPSYEQYPAAQHVDHHHPYSNGADSLFLRFDGIQFTDDVIFIDTHAFIATKAGFYPGLPNYVIQIIQPTHFIAITASPDEIHNRRIQDETRNRDAVSIEDIKKELAVQDAMLSSCSVLSGSPMKVIFNHEGKIEEAAASVLNAISL